VAEAAAVTTLQFVNGERPAGKTTLFNTPSELFTPTVVTKENLKEVLIDSGEIEAVAYSDLCSPEYATARSQAGLA
jgi:D-xylose transport system substrate-binding protein